MKVFRIILLLWCMATSLSNLYAQPAPNKDKNPVNQTDAKGRKNGTWVIYQPERMGEDAYCEFGNFDHGRKMGLWYKMDGEGDLISIETYRNNALDGEAKYFDKGLLNIVGHYRGLNPDNLYDSIIVTDPATGVESLRVIPTDRGTLKHGTWRYYDTKTGRLMREEEYQVDNLIYKKDFGLSKEDSAYYLQREKNLPHNKKGAYKLPPGKEGSQTY